MTTDDRQSPHTDDDVAARPPEEGGEPACLLDRVCPACGGLADAAPPTTCPRCGAEVPRT